MGYNATPPCEGATPYDTTSEHAMLNTILNFIDIYPSNTCNVEYDLQHWLDPGETVFVTNCYSNLTAGFVDGVEYANYRRVNFTITYGENCDQTMHTNGGLNRNRSQSFMQCPTGMVEQGKYCVQIPDASCPNEFPTKAGSGTKVQPDTDYRGNGSFPLTFTRYYNSQNYYHSLSSSKDPVFPIGQRWLHNYSQRVFPASASHLMATMQRSDGMIQYFDTDGNELVHLRGSKGKLEELFDSESALAGWRYTRKNDIVETYNASGYLVEVQNKSGHKHTVSYDEYNRIDTVTDDFDNVIQFDYSSEHSKMIDSVVLPDLTAVVYKYDESERLTDVIYPDDTLGDLEDNPVRSYLYENTSFPYALTGIVNEGGERFSTYTYDTAGRVQNTIHAGDVNSVTYEYIDSLTTKVTNPLGKETTYHFAIINGVKKLDWVEGHASSMCGASNRDYEYDTDGYLSSKTDWNNNLTEYTNYDSRGLAGTKTLKDSEGTVLKVIDTVWHSDFHLADLITEKALNEQGELITVRITDPVYDDLGRIRSRTITDPVNSVSRTTSYTYVPEGENGAGQIQTIDGPRTDVSDITTYRYNEQGLVKEIENALGHVTKVIDSDAAGRPKITEDPNAIQTTLTYTARGWLDTSTTLGHLTDYDYYANGLVKKITLPDDTWVEYEYDAAKRLTDIRDNLGNHMHYVLNAMGGQEQTDIYDPAGVLKKTQSAIYDELNRVRYSVGADAAEEIETVYDSNSNVDYREDPYNRMTDYSYDGLNRLYETEWFDETMTSQGTSTLTYDYWGNVKTVSDLNNNVTTYTYNGLGDLKKLESPDTGTTNYTHDNAGNVKTITDARNIEVVYTYDALNRISTIDYPGTDEDITYTYDQTDNSNAGIGRLTTITGSDYNIAYFYNQTGTLQSETHTLLGQPYQIGYGYNDANRLNKISYPGGLVIDYRLNEGGQVYEVESTRNGQTQMLVNNIQHNPFGPIGGYTYGNGKQLIRNYNLNYQLEGQQLDTSLILDYQYDLVGNIEQIDDILDNMNTEIFTYSPMYRLDTAQGNYGSRDYAFDANGNRTQLDDASTTTTYQHEAGSNRLDSIDTSVDIVTDLAGHITNRGDWSYEYLNSGRLERAKLNGLEQGSYRYNALGQRITKTVEGTTTAYLYGPDGQLLAEYQNDVPKVQYVRLQGEVIAAYYGQEEETPPAACPGTTATNSQHESAGRAYTVSETTGQTCWGSWCWGGTTTTTWYANGSGENLGTSGTTSTTLYENGANYWQTTDPGNCTVVETGPCESHTSTNQQHVDNSRAYTSTQMVGQTCWGSWCWGGTQQTIYKATGSNDNLGTDANASNTLYDDLNGNYYLTDPQTCPVENDTYIGWGYVHNNHLGAPTQVTDQVGTVIWAGSYSPFGIVTETVTDIEQNLRFPGQYHDRETGLYYNWNRYYSPELGRYITSDPIGLGGGLNTYGYVGGNPVMYTDPMGLCIWDACVVEFATAVAATAAAAACIGTNCVGEAAQGIEMGVDALTSSPSPSDNVPLPIPTPLPDAGTTVVPMAGLQTHPNPISHGRENELLKPYYGDDCNEMERMIRELTQTINWRRGDLNPLEKGTQGYYGHQQRIRNLREQRDNLERRRKSMGCDDPCNRGQG